MKKLLCLLMVLLLPVIACAEKLYPAKGNNGLWGYINAETEWVIAPQFDRATGFRGDYAVVLEYPEGFVDDPSNPVDEWDVACQGIIDRTGNFVVEPLAGYIDAGYDGRCYGGEDTGIWLICTDEGDGFFDIPSGYCSELGVNPWHWVSDSKLIPVAGGYMDRTNGDMVIRGEFDWVDPACFHDGIVSTSYVDMDDMPIKYFLMNEKGDVIPLPEGVSGVYQGVYSHDRMVVVDENERYGYADGAGNIVIPLAYQEAGDFSEGYAAVIFPEGDSGYIDADGHVLARGFTQAFSFNNGYAEVWLSGHDAATKETAWINAKGEIVPFMDSDWFYPISEGRIWMRTAKNYSSPLHLLDGEGNVLTDEPVYLAELAPVDFPEGLQAVCNEERKWGYIDLNGDVAIPFIYTAADAFDGELAWVRLEGREGYIDKSGNEVFMWECGANE